jgi:hypothetical protein
MKFFFLHCKQNPELSPNNVKVGEFLGRNTGDLIEGIIFMQINMALFS